ncbi:MAG: STAS domain-containing protein [Magnetococcus sp. YQC-5]
MMKDESCSLERTGDALIIFIDDVFDHAQRKRIQKTCEKQTGIDKYILDFKHVTRIESSTLGWMLFLRVRLGEDKANITLRNVNKLILEIFRMTKFHELFKIE